MAIRQAGTKQWTEARAQAAIAEWAASGLSGRDYARANGIDHQRLFWWRRRFEASKKSSMPALVPVVATATTLGPALVVTIGRCCFEVHQIDDVSAAWVVAVANGASR